LLGDNLVIRSELEAWKHELSDISNEKAAFLKSPDVVALLQPVIRHLQRQPSVAAVYRLMKARGMETYSISQFRKHWRGPEAWVNDRADKLLVALRKNGRINLETHPLILLAMDSLNARHRAAMAKRPKPV
jgi:hypothetical protein